jgi:hypothetical protein
MKHHLVSEKDIEADWDEYIKTLESLGLREWEEYYNTYSE